LLLRGSHEKYLPLIWHHVHLIWHLMPQWRLINRGLRSLKIVLGILLRLSLDHWRRTEN
jgi:hypothetical protein